MGIPSPSISSQTIFLTPISSITKSSPVLLFPNEFVWISKVIEVLGALTTILYFTQLKLPCNIFPVLSVLKIILELFFSCSVKFELVPNDVKGFAMYAENSYCCPTVSPVIVFV